MDCNGHQCRRMRVNAEHESSESARINTNPSGWMGFVKIRVDSLDSCSVFVLREAAIRFARMESFYDDNQPPNGDPRISHLAWNGRRASRARRGRRNRAGDQAADFQQCT